jgi:hypothetical protein
MLIATSYISGISIRIILKKLFWFMVNQTL